MNKNWTDAEIELMKQNLDKTDKEIWELLARGGSRHSFLAVRKQRQRLSMKKKAGRPPKKPTRYPDGEVVITWENPEDETRSENVDGV